MEVDSNGLITWIPQEGVLSSDFLTVYVYDDAENSLFDLKSFVVIVTPFNDPQLLPQAHLLRQCKAHYTNIR